MFGTVQLTVRPTYALPATAPPPFSSVIDT
jgi:hypothetical protein